MVGTAPMVALQACIELKAALHSSVSYKPSRMAKRGRSSQTSTYRHPCPSVDAYHPLHHGISVLQHGIIPLSALFFSLHSSNSNILLLLPQEKKNNLIFLLLFFSSRGEQMNGTAVTAPQ